MAGWSFYRLFTEIVDLNNKEDKFVNWLIGKSLLPSSRTCECGHEMKLLSQKDGSWGYFVCDLTCEHEDASPRMVSMFKGTLFEEVEFDPLSSVILMLCYAKDFTTQQAVEEVSYKFSIPLRVEKFYRICNEAISEAMFNSQSGNNQVGGEGIIIQLFQAKFGSRNKSTDMIKEDMCILCMIERDSKDFITEVYEEERQDIQALFGLIRHRVRPGSTIVTERVNEYMTVDQSRLYRFSGDYSLFPDCCHELQQQLTDTNQPHELPGDMVMREIFKRHCIYDGIHRFDSLVSIVNQANIS